MKAFDGTDLPKRFGCSLQLKRATHQHARSLTAVPYIRVNTPISTNTVSEITASHVLHHADQPGSQSAPRPMPNFTLRIQSG
jgi:hypothetical protein